MENNSVRFGVIAGLGVAIYQLLLYFINSEMILGSYAYVAWVIYIFCMWKAASLDKAANNGYISFRGAFKSSFVVFVITGLIATIFQYILFTVIDPGLAEMIQEKALESFQQSAEAQGLEEGSEQYETALEYTLKFSKPSIMIYSIFYGVSLIGGAIISAIIAAIIKKNKPAFLQEQNGGTEHLVD